MKFRNALPIIAFFILTSIFTFIAGVLLTTTKTWPTPDLIEAKSWVDRYLITGSFSPENQVFIPKHGYPEKAITINNADKLNSGYLAIEGWNESKGEYGIKLLDQNREQIHYWKLDYKAYDKDGPRNGSEMPHGLQIFKDGSLVVVHGKGDVLVKLDQCSNIQWIQSGVYHHQLSMADDGTLWTWKGENTSIAHYQEIINLNPDNGETIRSIDLIEDVIKKHNAWTLVKVKPNYVFRSFETDPTAKHNIFHANDVEALPAAYADMYPLFNPGDLLISFRRSNTVAVLDKVSSKIKWSMSGPWKRQHDPDFGADGNITIFDNLSKSPRSSIMSVNPNTKKVVELFNGNAPDFLTKNMGIHQILPNGNILVVIPEEGRVIEIDPKGNIQFEYYNIATSKALGHTENAVWFENGYFTQPLSCVDN